MRAPKFIGVYSPPARDDSRARSPLCFAWKLDAEKYAVQQIDGAYLPKGAPRLVSAYEFESEWRQRSNVLAMPVSTPDFRPLLIPSPATELTDASLEELNKARRIKRVETDLRDGFNKAIRALNRPRDRKGALAALEALAKTTKGVAPAHKHMFRDFGVTLRKKSLYEPALLCARRVVDLAPDDDHAHFNLARIFHALGMNAEAITHVKKAISLDSREEVYHKLLAWIKNGG